MILTVIVAVPGIKSYGSSEMNFPDRFVRNGQPDVLPNAVENLLTEVGYDVFTHARQRDGHEVAEDGVVDQLDFCVNHLCGNEHHR